MMADWARRVVQMLRDGQLVTNKWFDVTKTDSGTSVRFKWPTRRTVMKIKLNGALTRAFLARKEPDERVMPGNASYAMPLPLGFTPPDPTVPRGKTLAYDYEMMDGDPVCPGEHFIGLDTAATFTFDVEEDA